LPLYIARFAGSIAIVARLYAFENSTKITVSAKVSFTQDQNLPFESQPATSGLSSSSDVFSLRDGRRA